MHTITSRTVKIQFNYETMRMRTLTVVLLELRAKNTAHVTGNPKTCAK